VEIEHAFRQGRKVPVLTERTEHLDVNLTVALAGLAKCSLPNLHQSMP
jgi:hypothetical protein